MGVFVIKFYSSILDISKQQWDSIWPHPYESYSFYLSQEKANLKGFNFFYLVIYSKETAVLIAPLFCADFNLGLALEGFGQTVVSSIQKIIPRFMIMKFLFCGSPVTEKGDIGIHPEHEKDPELFAAFDQALLEATKNHKARMIMLKDFLDKDILKLDPLKSKGYFLGDSFPTVVLPIDFSTIEQYFAKLSYQTRKDIRRKIKKTEALGGLSVKEVNNIDDCADDIERLYLNIYNASSLRFEILNKQLFMNFCNNMPNETKFFLYYVDGKLIGFNYCLVQKDALVDKFIGLDYEYSKKYNLYFISLINNVKWCLENGKKIYFLSQNGYPVKTRMGAKLIRLRGFFKHVDPMINKIFNSVVGFLEPKKLDEGPVIEKDYHDFNHLKSR